MVPYLALGIFAGVRPEELMRLGGEDIVTDGISFNGQKAKTRQRRLITISENL
jgi:integrase